MLSIKNFSGILCVMLIFFAITGCRSFETDIDGRPCVALSAKEINRLVLISRATMQKNASKRLVTPQEARFAVSQEPQINIIYRGDKFGTAIVSWRIKKRLIRFHFEHDLTAEYPSCAMEILDVPDATSQLPNKITPGW